MQKYVKFFASALVLSLMSLSLQASENKPPENPYDIVRVVADNTFTRISKEQDKISQDMNYMRVIVQEELLPYVDYRYAALKVIGKNLSKTSKEQRSEFVKVFKDYLVTTYASVLTQYKDQKVEFEPTRSVEGKRMVTIKTKIVEKGRPDINIDFKVRKNKKSGEWKAFDMVAEGISLLDSKRAELSTLIRQKGIDSVIALLRKKAEAPVQSKKEESKA
ncbi:MlaC/ttg2D family ABC transporter substrate-binding protein [Algicola sagamiensis]|uniref:MlaC/ttg2D family ABC transporter substrate-binding protein n=1 Tax=Algicola sagamiensis TaxID=163869 RepID=UPI000373F243|nr:ABC transporter substrate-binding protein [Algicola sagamiensis]